jgi:quercetin dioxygenase-like cupin family protein
MNNPYLRDMRDSGCWLYPTVAKDSSGNVGEEQRTIVMPEGPHRRFTFTDSLMHPSPPAKDGAIGLHEHWQGYETFFVDSGSLDFYINGQKCRVKAGDIIHMQPYEAHGFVFLDRVRFRGAFLNWNCADDAFATNLMEQHVPDAKSDPKYFGILLKNIDLHMREAADCVEVPAEECRAVRNPDRPLAEFRLDGATAKMLTARWENGGLRELWRFEMEPGFRAEWKDYPESTEVYYVTEGKIRFRVYDEEFVAERDCVVYVPKYAPHGFEVVEKAALYDIGGVTRWYALFQDYFSLLKRSPERLSDGKTLDALKEKYGCPVKAAGR